LGFGIQDLEFGIWNYLLSVDAAFGGWDFALGIGMEILLLLILLQKIAMESPTRRGTPKKIVYLPKRAISQKMKYATGLSYVLFEYFVQPF
jgi:hypothetical protein